MLNNFNQFITDLGTHVYGYYDYLVALLPKLIIGLIILTIWWLVAKRIKTTLVRQLTKNTDDPLTIRFIGRIAFVCMILIGILFFLKVVGLGSVATGILGTAGVSAFIIGFAFKDIGEHFLGGFVLAFNRPFRVGDLVELNGQKGTVMALNIRDTHLKTFDGRDLYIPNGSIIKNTLVNYTIDGYMRHEFNLGLDYEENVEEAIKTILEVVPTVPGVLDEDRKPSVAIRDLGASSLNLTVYYWLDTFDKSVSGGKVRIEVIKSVLDALGNKGFYLPGDIVELKNYSKENLRVAQ